MMDAKLAMKIYNVMSESSGLQKDMMVAGQYKAVSEKMVLNEIKPLLKKHKLILVPVKATATQEGKMTQIVATYKIIDAETGEFEILETVGNGTDSQDKGSGKAWTYAYKCLIQKTFCLFSGEDTDNHHSDEISNQDNKPKQGNQSTKWSKNSVINFGKHKGQIISEIWKHDKPYLEYLRDNATDEKLREYLAIILKPTDEQIEQEFDRYVGKELRNLAKDI